jgi:DNA-binding transcriptional MocR family regulator
MKAFCTKGVYRLKLKGTGTDIFILMGTDNLTKDSQTKYQHIAEHFESRIIEGYLYPGEKLPSIRQIAQTYQVAKNTAISALQLLEAKALIEAKPKSGFIVKQRATNSLPTLPSFQNIQPSAVTIPELLQQVIARGAAFDIKPNEPVDSPHHLITKLHRNINKAMRGQQARKTVYYDEPQGFAPLRTQVAHHYAKLGLSLDTAKVYTTSGCQHSLLLALMATCQPGDNVIIESPGFYGVIQLLDELGLKAIEVPCHSVSGIDIEAVSMVLNKYKVAACVVTPAFSTPTGACMPDDAKIALLELAEKYGFAVIEDDIYGDLGFHFRPKPIKHFDRGDNVILCSSFSKSLSRDLRVGWVYAGKWYKRIQRLKLVSHLAGSQSVQAGLSEFVASGDYSRYLNFRTNQLAEQRQMLINEMLKIWGTEVKFSQPLGGLCLWAELPGLKDTLSLYHLALKLNIVITPGALFSANNDFSQFLRLSFCHPLTEQRKTAFKQLGKLIRSTNLNTQ